MICKNCKAEFEGKNFAFVFNSTQKTEIHDICSVDCRAQYRVKIENRKAAAANRTKKTSSGGSGNAKNGVKYGRPLIK